MRDVGGWEPAGGDAIHPPPVQAVTLASVPKRRTPVSGCLVPEGSDRTAVAWHGVVGEMTSHHARQPAPLLGDEEVPASPKLGFHLLELGP